MKYLVVAEPVTTGLPASPEDLVQLMELMVNPTYEILEQWESEGRISGGMFAARRGGAFVVEADSHDQVSEMCSQLPIWGMANWEVTPLQALSNRKTQDQQRLELAREMASQSS